MAARAYSSARLSRAPSAAAAAKQQQGSRPGELLTLPVDGGGSSGGDSGGRAHATTLLYIPSTYKPGVPAPLVLTLHGAGGDAHGGLHHLIEHADEFGTILLSPTSRSSTWDMLRGGYGPDVALIDQAMQQTLRQLDVDLQRVCASGFSDGASYALSLGAANGDLFTHIAAFSPGFMRPPLTVGKPLVYISHGTHDRVLRIDYCSRRLVPRLQAESYQVNYHEFDGPHTVPASIARQALAWLVNSKGQPASRRED